jgi:hypothetical protein
MPDFQDGENPADLHEMDGEEAFAFPPTERRLVTQPLDLSVQTLFDQWNEKLLILPDIQREYVWDNGKASRLVESILLNIPIPVMYFAETNEARYEIFDGHQRVRSIARYMNNEFGLYGLAVLREYKGQKFYQLSEREQRFFRMRTLRIILISIESHPNMKFEIYERLNTGSIMLNAQELRNSIYRGPLNNLLHDLAREPAFRSLIGTKSPRRRMVDEELILRFFAMQQDLPSYRAPLKRFLNEYMDRQAASNQSAIEEIRSTFFSTISTVHECLGSSAFRVLDKDGDPTETVVNRALFDAQMLAFSWLRQRTPAASSQAIRAEIAKLFEDELFLDAIQRATGDKSRILRRIRETASALQRAGASLEVPFDLAK